MNRNEALRLLGLSADATSEEVKAAYRETAQILHPDRFASNKKLQERATEQFKNLQEAYEVLTSGKGSSARARETVASSAEEAEINARLAGISAARKQLLTQRDVALDERRSGFADGGHRRFGGTRVRAQARRARRCREHRRGVCGVGHRESGERAENREHPQRSPRRARR